MQHSENMERNKKAKLKHAHLQFAQANAQTKNCKRACFANVQKQTKMTRTNTTEKKGEVLTAVLRNGGCSGKLKVSFPNQHLWWVYSEVLRNPPLRKAAKR